MADQHHDTANIEVEWSPYVDATTVSQEDKIDTSTLEVEWSPYVDATTGPSQADKINTTVIEVEWSPTNDLYVVPTPTIVLHTDMSSRLIDLYDAPSVKIVRTPITREGRLLSSGVLIYNYGSGGSLVDLKLIEEHGNDRTTVTHKHKGQDRQTAPSKLNARPPMKKRGTDGDIVPDARTGGKGAHRVIDHHDAPFGKNRDPHGKDPS